MEFSHMLKYERELRGWSQARLAEELGTTLTSISRWERGLALPSPHFRQQLSMLLGKNAHELKLLPDDVLDHVKESTQPDEPIEKTISVVVEPPAEVQVIPSVPSVPRNAKRQWLLNKVRRFWIKGVLEFSLHEAHVIALRLQKDTEAVTNAWRINLRNQALLPSGTHIRQVYDDADGELLILGEPGSGKTTLLLELARELVARAEQDEIHPMPVVFNLSSWGQKRQPIMHWLAEELHTKYQVPRKLSQHWIETNQVLPLLDGLDEVSTDHRAACVEALNIYRQEHGLVPMVVCSRKASYLAQTEHLLLHSAVVVQPLTTQQIEEYLSSQEAPLAAVRAALGNDPALQELVATPLMLTMLIQSSKGSTSQEMLGVASLEKRRQEVFAGYVQRMLEGRTKDTHYTREQTMHWLTWLAKQMQQHAQTEFFIEQQQVDWLPTRRLRRLYRRLTSRVTFGLLSGMMGILLVMGANVSEPKNWLIFGVTLLCGLLFGSVHKPENIDQASETTRPSRISRVWSRLRQSLLASLIFGVGIGVTVWLISKPSEALIQGLLAGVGGLLLGGLLVGLRLVRDFDGHIRPIEVVGWSWAKLWRGFGRKVGKGALFGLGGGCILGFCIGLSIGLLTIPTHRLLAGLLIGLLFGVLSGISLGLSLSLFGGVVIGCLWGLAGGLTKEELSKDKLVKPNEGLRRSLHNSLLVGGVSGFITLLFFGFANVVFHSLYVPLSTQAGHPLSGFNAHVSGVVLLTSGVGLALLIGLVLGLRNGGEACIQHGLLRLLLWRAGCLPGNYPKFLDYAAEHVLLRKVGSGYIFVHGLLLEYFASLENAQQAVEEFPQRVSCRA